MTRREFVLAIFLTLVIPLSAIPVTLGHIHPHVTTFNTSFTGRVPIYVYYEMGTGQQWLIFRYEDKYYLTGAVSPCGTLIYKHPRLLPYVDSVRGTCVGYFDGNVHITYALPKPYVFS